MGYVPKESTVWNDTKTCARCIHYNAYIGDAPICERWPATGLDIVTGKATRRHWQTCKSERAGQPPVLEVLGLRSPRDRCGPEGKYWNKRAEGFAPTGHRPPPPAKND